MHVHKDLDKTLWVRKLYSALYLLSSLILYIARTLPAELLM